MIFIITTDDRRWTMDEKRQPIEPHRSCQLFAPLWITWQICARTSRPAFQMSFYQYTCKPGRILTRLAFLQLLALHRIVCLRKRPCIAACANSPKGSYRQIEMIFVLDRSTNTFPLAENALISQVFPSPFQTQGDRPASPERCLFFSSLVHRPSSLAFRVQS